MRKNYLLLALLCLSILGFSQEFKLDFEGSDPLNSLPAGVTHINGTEVVPGTSDVWVYMKVNGSNVYATYTQEANTIIEDPDNASNKILKMDYLGHLIFDEAAIGTGSFTIAGYYNGYTFGANPQSVGCISVTGSADAGTTWENHQLLHFYGNGQMTGLISVPSANGFPFLTTAMKHLVFTFNDSDNMYRIYSNGVLAGTSTEKPVWTGKKVYLGYRGGDQDPVTGAFTSPNLDITQTPNRNKDVQTRVDDITVFKRAISDAEALTLFTNGSLAVNKVSQENFNAYPNPVKDRLYFSTNKIASAEIYNLLGSKITSQKVNNGIDMSSLSKGLYLVKCQDSEGVNVATVKVIKE